MTGSSPATAVAAPPDDSAARRGGKPLARIAGWSFVLFMAATPVATAPMSIAGGLCLALTLIAWLAR
jgi:hypothetical protein